MDWRGEESAHSPPKADGEVVLIETLAVALLADGCFGTYAFGGGRDARHRRQEDLAVHACTEEDEDGDAQELGEGLPQHVAVFSVSWTLMICRRMYR